MIRSGSFNLTEYLSVLLNKVININHREATSYIFTLLCWHHCAHLIEEARILCMDLETVKHCTQGFLVFQGLTYDLLEIMRQRKRQK